VRVLTRGGESSTDSRLHVRRDGFPQGVPSPGTYSIDGVTVNVEYLLNTNVWYDGAKRLGSGHPHEHVTRPGHVQFRAAVADQQPAGAHRDRRDLRRPRVGPLTRATAGDGAVRATPHPRQDGHAPRGASFPPERDTASFVTRLLPEAPDGTNASLVELADLVGNRDVKGAGYRVRTGDIQLGKTKIAVWGRNGQCQVVETTSGGVTWTSSPLRRVGGKSGGKNGRSFGGNG